MRHLPLHTVLGRHVQPIPSLLNETHVTSTPQLALDQATSGGVTTSNTNDNLWDALADLQRFNEEQMEEDGRGMNMTMDIPPPQSTQADRIMEQFAKSISNMTTAIQGSLMESLDKIITTRLQNLRPQIDAQLEPSTPRFRLPRNDRLNDVLDDADDADTEDNGRPFRLPGRALGKRDNDSNKLNVRLHYIYHGFVLFMHQSGSYTWIPKGHWSLEQRTSPAWSSSSRDHPSNSSGHL